MADGIITRHTTINAGAMPASVEELAQKHQDLFQEYSRLKARHTILKKAVKKERTDNASLQENVKDKEKELRKLQGQLDILTFHNERLSKRIEAVQEIETKGSHFSLLGGAIKKELEKSTQALDAANVDLAKKIEENEELHTELSEISHIYTSDLNRLYTQIAVLEERIKDLQDERTLLHSETSSQSSVLVKEKDDLAKEITRLQDDLSLKIQQLDKYQQRHDVSKDDDQHLAEKDLTVTELKAERADQAIAANRHIKVLENEIKSLEDAIIQRKSQHAVTTEALDENTRRLEQELTDMEATIAQLQDQNQSATEDGRLEALEKELSNLQQANDLLKEVNDKLEFEKTTLAKDNSTLRIDTVGIIDRLTEEVQEKTGILDVMEKKIVDLETELEEQQHQISALQEQFVSYEEAIHTKESIHRENDSNNDDDDEQPFVYPVPSEQSLTTIDTKYGSQDGGNHGSKKPNNDDDSSMAANTNGVSSPETTSKLNGSETWDGSDSNNDQGDITQDKLNVESIIQDRENKLKQYYESRVNQLTEKLQMADSKATRFAGLVNSLKEKLVEENEEKQGLRNEIQNLKEEVVKAKESLTTTESKYQEQLDVLTEYTTSLQIEVSKAQTRTPAI